MPKKPDRPKELDVLGKRVREASEVIGHLRDSNRALANELEQMKLRLADAPPVDTPGKGGHSAELKLLREERKQIRDRIIQLLDQLEEVSSSPSAE